MSISLGNIGANARVNIHFNSIQEQTPVNLTVGDIAQGAIVNISTDGKKAFYSSASASAWHQKKYIKADVTSSIFWNNAALITTLMNGSIIWRAWPGLAVNGTTIQTNYILNNPLIVAGSLFYVGSNSNNAWDILKIDPVGRQITAQTDNQTIFGIATDQTHLWAITSKSGILQINPDDLSILGTYKTGIQLPDILMYVSNFLVVGDSNGGVTVFDSATVAKAGYTHTSFGECSLTVMNDQIAVSNPFQNQGALVMLDPSTMGETPSSLGTLPYNGASSIIQMGTEYFTATPIGVGMYSMNADNQLEFQSMLLQAPAGQYLNTTDLNVIDENTFIATGYDGIYVFTNNPTSGPKQMHFGAASHSITPSRKKAYYREAEKALEV